MDIKHLYYFLSIVEHNFNLSRAAESLYIVQPTLSTMINAFEKNEQIVLFNRRKGRIVGLSHQGEIFYNDALEVVEKYNQMMRNVRNQGLELHGQINLGVPPVFLASIFGAAMPEMIATNPNIQFNIVEDGAKILSNKLLTGEVDIASLISPEGISHDLIESYEIHNSELVMFMHENHPLAHKEQLKWEDLNSRNFATLDQSFMISKMFIRRCNIQNIIPNIIFQSASYEILFDLVNRDHDLMTFMQLPAQILVRHPKVIAKRIANPIPWVATLCRLKKPAYTSVEDFVFTELLAQFKNLPTH